MRSRTGRMLVGGALLAVLVALAAGLSLATRAGAADSGSNYLVVYKSQSVPSDAASAIEASGGSLVYGYSKIGVAVASSSSSSFADKLRSNSKVEGVAGTAGFATQLPDQADSSDSADAPVPGTPAPGSDSLSGRQWDMDQIHAPEARAINGGSTSVVVGDIDTGLDYTHPDLAPNVDFAEQRLLPRRSSEHGAVRRGTTRTGTVPTPRARSRRRRTASGSSASPRT